MLVEHKIEFSSNGITVTQRFGPDDNSLSSDDIFEAQFLPATYAEFQSASAAKSNSKAHSKSMQGSKGGGPVGKPSGGGPEDDSGIAGPVTKPGGGRGGPSAPDGGLPGIFIGPIIFTQSPEQKS